MRYNGSKANARPITKEKLNKWKEKYPNTSEKELLKKLNRYLIS